MLLVLLAAILPSSSSLHLPPATAHLTSAHSTRVAPVRWMRLGCGSGQSGDASAAGDVTEAEARARVGAMVERDRVVLFMKGSKESPRCGFSKVRG